MSISQLIFAHISIYKDILDNYIHTIKTEELFVVIIHMNVDRTVSILFYDDFMTTKTLNHKNWKYK